MDVALFLVSVILMVGGEEQSVSRTSYAHQQEMKVETILWSLFRLGISKDDLQAELEALAEGNPELASTYVLGHSVQV